PQRQRVLDEKVHRQAPLGRLGLGPPDYLFQEVDAGHPAAPGGEEQGVFARTTAGVEDAARDLVGDRNERPLRPANVPGRLPGVEVLEGGTVYRAAYGGGHEAPSCSVRGC